MEEQQLKTHFVVNYKTMIEVGACLSSPEEYRTFIYSIITLTNELYSICGQRAVCADPEESMKLNLTSICALGIFYRENMDLFNEILKKLKYSAFTEEEIKGFTD